MVVPLGAQEVQDSPVPEGRQGRCVSIGQRDHRVLLVVEGRLLKSRKVRDPELLKRIVPGTQCHLDGAEPPEILGIIDA
jgi:hypothetical protein